MFEKLLGSFGKLLGLPLVASEHGQSVNQLVIYVHILMAVLFVGWMLYFVYTLWRFHAPRNPKADYLGVKNHASSYVEVTVAVIEVLLLVVVAVPLWAKSVDKFPAESDSTVIQIVAQQFAWNIRYPGADHAFGKQQMTFVSDTNLFGIDPTDPLGKDDIQTLNEIHVPVNKPVIAYISSKDVIHSFKIVSMRVTQDAIPGMRIPIHFTPIMEGRFQISCAQLCGIGHASMASGFLVVQSEADYEKWLATKAPTPAGAASFE
jgi:cytochrome c oxidase subunit 2